MWSCRGWYAVCYGISSCHRPPCLFRSPFDSYVSRSCQWWFAIVVVSTLVASLAISSALSFPAISICPGTHDTSMLAPVFSSRNVVAVSTNFCDICWLDPGLSLLLRQPKMCCRHIVWYLTVFCSLPALLVGIRSLFPVALITPAFCQDLMHSIASFG